MPKVRDDRGFIRRKVGLFVDVLDAVKYRRLVNMAAEAERFESTPWASSVPLYFVLMRLVREQPDLLFSGYSNGRQRAAQIDSALLAHQYQIEGDGRR